MMNYLLQLLICSCLFVSANTSAQQQDPTALETDARVEERSVEVTGVKDPELKSYVNMLQGVKVFHEMNRISPDAKLRFRLIAIDASVNFKNITLRLASDNVSVGVPLTSEGYFTLEEGIVPATEDVDLMLNLRKNLLRWRPDVRSANLPENTRRLGDLRLECEVRWAIEKEDMSFIKRNGFRLLGGPCNSSRISPIFITDRLITQARLISPSKNKEINLQVNGKFYTLPLYDKEWENDSVIEFEFK